MYSWNDIVILGDSFCAERKTPDHWPYRLASLLTNCDPGPSKPAKGYGWSGASWWSVKNSLSFYLSSKPKVVIFCHTDPMRLPNDQNKPLTLTSSLDEKYQGQSADKNLWAAAKMYFQHLVSEKFHLWAQEQWFKEIDEMTKDTDQVYHLHCFYGTWNNYEFKQGVRINKDTLFNYAQINTKDQYYNNHLTVEDNHRLAEQLADLINNYPGHGQVVSKFNLKDRRP